jgi:antitoxin VapB
MPLNIKSAKADRLVRELAALTGESMTEAVTLAVAERLERCRRERNHGRRAALEAIFSRASKLPRRGVESDDEILGYNEAGTFE